MDPYSIEQAIQRLKDMYGEEAKYSKPWFGGTPEPIKGGYISGEGADAKFAIPSKENPKKFIIWNAAELANDAFKELSPFQVVQPAKGDFGGQIGWDPKRNGYYFVYTKYNKDTKEYEPYYSDIQAKDPNASASGAASRVLFPEERALLVAQKDAAEAGIQNAKDTLAYNYKRLAQEQQNNSFTQTQALYASARDDKRLAMEASQNLFAQQNSIANLQLNIANAIQAQNNFQSQMDWSVEQLNANAINEAARFNAQMGFNVEQANVAAQQRRQEQLQSLARDISESAKAPGDYGKLAALTLANTGWGAPATAIGRGADLRTTQSLAPLESQLRTRQNVMAQPERPFTFTPMTPSLAQRPVIAPLDLSQIKIPQVPTAGEVLAPNAISQAAAVSPTLGNLVGALGQGTSSQSVNAALNAAIATQQDGTTGYQGMAKGGVANGAYISGERGPELNIPLGDKTIVLNQKQMKAAGIDLKKLMSDSNKPKQFADGGVFDQGWGNVTDPDRTLSMNFLNDALARARAGTPWQSGPLPTPVYASTPGFSPLVMQTLGSLTSMAQGIPTEYFQELAAKYRPSGVRESVTQRTA